MKGTVKHYSIKTNLELAIQGLFEFINFLINSQEDQLNKKENKFNTLQKQKDQFENYVALVDLSVFKIIEDAEAVHEKRKTSKETLYKTICLFENHALEYENSLKQISVKTVSFYRNINKAIHDVRMELLNHMHLLSVTEKNNMIDNIDNEMIIFSDAFQAYIKSRKSSTSLEYYALHSSIFDNSYKMIHFALVVTEIEHFLDLPTEEIVSYDLRLVCARMQVLCKNPDFMVARKFVTKLFDFKLDNVEMMSSENLNHKASLKLDLLEYILNPKQTSAKFYINIDIKKKDSYYLLHRLHKEDWVKKKLIQAMKNSQFYLKDGIKETKITYAAVIKLLNNHDLKTNDRIDGLFV